MHDERDLVRRAHAGEAGAFRVLVERHQRDVYRLAYDLCGNHHDAEDLSQDVFIRAHRALGNFRADAKLSSWLYRITMNAFIDSRRRKPVQVVSLDGSPRPGESGVPPEIPAPGGAPDERAGSTRFQEDVERALESLSCRERTVFVMRHYHDMPIREIAASLSLAEGTVKSLLFRSIRKLRDRLEQYRDEAGGLA